MWWCPSRHELGGEERLGTGRHRTQVSLGPNLRESGCGKQAECGDRTTDARQHGESIRPASPDGPRRFRGSDGQLRWTAPCGRMDQCNPTDRAAKRRGPPRASAASGAQAAFRGEAAACRIGAMTNTRRELLKGGLAVAGLSLFGVPEWALPALAQGETLVPFTDLPENANFTPAADRRLLDVANDRRRHSRPRTSSSRRSTTVIPSSIRPPSAEGHGPGGQAAGAVARRPPEAGQAPSSSPASSAPATAVPCRG